MVRFKDFMNKQVLFFSVLPLLGVDGLTKNYNN